MSSILFESTRKILPTDFHYLPSQYKLYPVSSYLTGMYVEGKPSDWYWWGMRVAEESNHEISFLGVNILSDYPSDPYHLNILTSMSHVPRNRGQVEARFFEELTDIFLQAIRAYKYSDIEIDRIAKVCSLGDDPDESYTYCRMLFYECLVKDYTVTKHSILYNPHYEWVSHCGIPNNNTFVRFMAHMCYLYQQAKPTGLGALLSRLLGV